MFYWTKYRCHGNIAGNKPALINGSDLFSENPIVKFFHHLSLGNSEKYCPTGLVKFDRQIVCNFVFSISTFSEQVLTSDFNFCVQASCACSELLFYQISWNSSERFRRNQCTSTKPCSHNFLVNCACIAFDRVSIFLDPLIQTITERQGPIVLPITNCLIVKMEYK